MGYQNNYMKNRNLRRYCSHCGKKLTSNDKGRSLDYGLMAEKHGYPRPLCVDHAYFFASKYIEENLEKLRANFNTRMKSS